MGGFGRAYNSTYGIKDGEYLFDTRDGLSRTKSEIQARLDAGQAVALREYYAIPEPVDSFAKASSKPWSSQKVDILTREELKERAEREGTEPNYSGVVMKNTVRASRTIGGGEQIFNDGGRAFTFYD